MLAASAKNLARPDLRGRFDYSSLNTNELEIVQKFSLLVMSDDHGAVVREANPPKR